MAFGKSCYTPTIAEIFLMFAHASVTLDLEISHRFLEIGHTQNENDSMHAVIEVAKKRHSNIYTPNQWIILIKMAKVTPLQYRVKGMSQEDCFSFKPVVQKQNWKSTNTAEVVKISKISENHFDPKNPYKVYFTYSFSEN
ncbi:unnamed protein product [Diabrotica balteata]|uniref:Uncharacterized protein n=1 Tax=Diabrotica balteata TaxID=107213 RepID=A0A9N9SSL0_DIABA|nr:unnamed protein product [Diabrotica balteata]